MVATALPTMATAASIPALTSPIAQDAPHRDLTQLRTWLFLLHALLMILAFLLLFPLGILVGRFGRTAIQPLPGGWFKHHRALQGSGLLVALLGAVLAVCAVQVAGIKHFSRPHMQWGLAIVLLVLLQAAGGQAGHVIRQRYGWRVQNAGHVIGGIVVYVLAAINIQRGMHDWGWKPAPISAHLLLGWSIALGVIYVAGLGLIPAQIREEREHGVRRRSGNGGERAPLLQ